MLKPLRLAEGAVSDVVRNTIVLVNNEKTQVCILYSFSAVDAWMLKHNT